MARTTKDDLTMMTICSRFSTEESAREYFESVRWPDGPVCPHCGNEDGDHIQKLAANPAKKIRAGLYFCGLCRENFTVTIGTPMEKSKVPLNKWLIAWYMMCSSKTQIAALQIQRQLEIGSYHTAEFLCQRIRFALADFFPLTKMDGTVEVDETYIGGKVKGMGRRYCGNKTPVIAIVERGGDVHSQVMQPVNGAALGQLIKDHVSPVAHLNTDESRLYDKVGAAYASHDTVNHSADEYVRFDEVTKRIATTNTVEGFFGNAKRSLDGTHHHVSEKYLPLYLAEIDHKYNTRTVSDGERTVLGIQKMEGKRLMRRAPKTEEA